MSAPPRPEPAGASEGDDRVVDPRGVRVSLAPSSASAALAPLVLEPPELPVVSAPPAAGERASGGSAPPGVHAEVEGGPGIVLVDGSPIAAELVPLDLERAILIRDGAGGTRDRVLLLPATPAPGAGRSAVRREVIVGGWRVEVEVEPAARAALRERARRDRGDVGPGGPVEVRAIIPGVVLSVSVSVGDAVTAGQQLLVVEAMKMQNELRAARDGSIERVAVGAGERIEVGDLLLVLA